MLQQAAVQEQLEEQRKQAAALLRLQQSQLRGGGVDNFTSHPGAVQPNASSPHAAGNATSLSVTVSAQALPPSRPEHRPPAPQGPAAGKQQVSGLPLSTTEASALLDLFFNHVTSPPGCAPSSSGPHSEASCPAEGDWAQRRRLMPAVGAVHELRDEAAQQFMGLMEGMWRALPPSRPNQPSPKSEQTMGNSPCISKGGQDLLARVSEAAARLHQTACTRALQGGDAAEPSLPYVLLRRITMALLVVLHGQEGPSSFECREMVSEVGGNCTGWGVLQHGAAQRVWNGLMSV